MIANAVRPAHGFRTGVPSFFAGWATNELAPHLIAATVADVAVTTVRRKSTLAGVALAGANIAALTWIARNGTRSGDDSESALAAALGPDWRSELPPAGTPAPTSPWRRRINPFAFGDAAVAVDRDVVYNPDNRSRGLLDIYRPATPGATPAPVLLQIHGGAWTVGDKAQQGLPLMHHLAARGWVCVAINYSLSPKATMPAHIIEVKRAIAWIKDHIGEYGGDPSYLAVSGGSAGGHLTALAGLTANDPEFQPGFEAADTSVSVAVPHYGVYDMCGDSGLRSSVALRDRFLAPRVYHTTFAENPELFRRTSPIARITEDAPDFFVLHGVDDTLVPVRQARRFVDALRATSRGRVVYAELPHAQHAWDIFHSARADRVVESVAGFLNWHHRQWIQQRSVAAAR